MELRRAVVLARTPSLSILGAEQAQRLGISLRRTRPNNSDVRDLDLKAPDLIPGLHSWMVLRDLTRSTLVWLMQLCRLIGFSSEIYTSPENVSLAHQRRTATSVMVSQHCSY